MIWTRFYPKATATRANYLIARFLKIITISLPTASRTCDNQKKSISTRCLKELPTMTWFGHSNNLAPLKVRFFELHWEKSAINFGRSFWILPRSGIYLFEKERSCAIHLKKIITKILFQQICFFTKILTK
jgi:hypothetical protein